MISSLDAAVQSYASQLFSSQQAQTVTDPFLPDPLASSTGASTASAVAAGSNSLTGTGAASLDSQTLGALLGLAQQDPADPSQGGQTSRTQGTHRHHHHHGGGAPQTSPTSSNASTASTSDPATDATVEADDVDASLESALLSA